MQMIEQYIQNYFGIKSQDLSSIADLFVEKEYPKNAYLLKAEQQADQLCFIKSGMFRVYSYDAGGNKEITQWISTKGTFMTDLASLIFGSPARWYIQALTDSTLFSISKTNYNRLGEIVPDWHLLEKLFIAKCFVTLEDRVFNQLSMSAEEKYQALFAQSPEIFNQVPLQYIASMLGMTPETLSRIRRKQLS